MITGPAVEKAMTYIDRISAILVTVVRRSQSQDANGDYGSITSTMLFSGIVADIQPVSGKLVQSESGFNPETTHLMFLEQKVSGIEAMDIVQHGAKEYEVLAPADWREHDEYQLRAL